LLFTFVCCGQSLTPQEVIDRSIEYHDPRGRLLKGYIKMNFVETRPDNTFRKTSVNFKAREQFCEITSKRDGHRIMQRIRREKVRIEVDGKSKFPVKLKKKYRLTEERARKMMDYYSYLWLMPAKLTDPGSIIGDEVKIVDYFGQELLEIRVTYAPEVGDDVWYFYFDPKTYALSGYRFYHDEAKNDGEYIILKGEHESSYVKLPKERIWYTHAEGKLLGSDALITLRVH